ncbi:PBP1A family penicillin-binding protein [Pseudenhygromyxa sp. WMMC2535]|uniref:penicillin-binding protein 1A n=1 Tax=Pseudenhygromyxa sp. WMMC2535 TaxID=2712867 RepID=UPI001554A89D|nr:PBP1A family penicillin-binding protein [Pseudenhygromyxa sp. WMMC2535]NVB41436.1 PBP1A family penicillin-binding protein [Pseudenhygromyxa sp. WMMC2535]
MGWLFRYGLFTLILLALSTLFVGRAAYRYFAAELPSLSAVDDYRDQAPGVTRIHAADGSLLAELAREHRSYAPLSDIPEQLISAFLSAEDRRFFEHTGLDYRGLARAMKANLQSGTVVQGGSTITQQVAKSFLADQDRTLDRKLREAILSLKMESSLGKGPILEIYLNKIFLGHGAYGVRAAASRYFDKDLDELSLAESALIAGMAQAPSRWSPVSNPDLAMRRRNIVLRDMVEAGYISSDEAEAAAAEPIELAELRSDPFRRRAPFYAEHVRQLTVERLGEDAVLADGLVIESAVALPIQAAADRSVGKAARALDRRQGWRGPEAHLRNADEREALRERMRAEYGEQPFADPERWILGLVSDVRQYEASVELGAITTRLTLRHADWAAPYDPRSGVNDQRTNSLEDALVVGDVIWVRAVRDREGAMVRGEPHAEPTPADGTGEGTKPSAGANADNADEEGPLLVELGQTPLVEAASFTFDHHSGQVVAMAGGVDYDRSQYDRTTSACRSPGSVFKAIYYALALDQGWQMDDVLEAKAWEPEPGEEWNPRNIDKTLDGKVLLRTALIKSLNTPSIRLFLAVGIHETITFARKLGFTSELIPDKGLSLGASCVRIDELSAAFGVFARGGSLQRPLYIQRITDKRGVTRLDQRDPEAGAVDIAGRIDRMAARQLEAPEQLLDHRSNYLISRLLREVVTSGTATRASHIGAPAAGKSGTSSGRYKRDGHWDDLTTDTWFVGFTARHVSAAWMGFDDRNERSLGDEDASYTTAIPMWADFMKQVVGEREYPQIPGEPPEGVGRKQVDATHGGTPVPGMPAATIYYRQDLRRDGGAAN